MNDIALVDYDAIIAKMGEGAFLDAINRADLIGLVNWTMISYMTEILESILEKVLPNLGPKETGRTFFFDLADPAKRSISDLKEVLYVIRRYQNHGQTILGLNFSEARQVAKALDISPVENTADGLKSAAHRIRTALEIGLVVIHPREGAACATREDTWYTDGPFCEKPKISTGAGDHFNAGFASAITLGLTPPVALTVAVATSGYYVRTAKSPSIREIGNFIESWT